MKCSSCGATIPDGSRKCVYCGESLPEKSAAGGLAAHPEPGNVFDRIRQSPQFLRANTVERLAAIAKPGLLGMAIPVVFLAVFVIAALGIGLSAASIAPPIFVIVPVGMAIVGILMAVGVVQLGIKVSRAPLTPRAAVVKSKRTSVTSGSANMSASTSYYATFEFADSSREEFEVPDSLFSQFAENDAGVLFTRANTVAAFDRVAETPS
jgi:Protein of unknown function (DUF2500)/zinc-ribbon domain